jgi:hypothetical protein
MAPDNPTLLIEILEGLAVAGQTGNQAGAPLSVALLAEAQHGAGQLADARATVETGLAVAAQTGQAPFDAELHRLQGEIVLKTDSPQSEAESQTTAEECFHRALDIARTQEAKSFELRAATGLARLWRDQGKRAAARDLLAPLYAWFTEGAARSAISARGEGAAGGARNDALGDQRGAKGLGWAPAAQPAHRDPRDGCGDRARGESDQRRTTEQERQELIAPGQGGGPFLD